MCVRSGFWRHPIFKTKVMHPSSFLSCQLTSVVSSARGKIWKNDWLTAFVCLLTTAYVIFGQVGLRLTVPMLPLLNSVAALAFFWIAAGDRLLLRNNRMRWRVSKVFRNANTRLVAYWCSFSCCLHYMTLVDHRDWLARYHCNFDEDQYKSKSVSLSLGSRCSSRGATWRSFSADCTNRILFLCFFAALP